eukprot:TRINITY_DN6617_c1_g3_i3.p1 TRINITY_DN6617_c1_g3~~TRINITY_DN6617_c1_g3_i3.p1  ORF type:complete len:281 (-),score=34.90 TRINITY_DN6617_c1_g3_i3:167-1009(-)
MTTTSADGYDSWHEKLRLQKSMQVHRDHFDAIVRGSVTNVRTAFTSILKDIQDGRDLALEMLMNDFAHTLQRRLDCFVHVSIEENWAKISTANKGYLLPKEMRSLVHDIFAELLHNLPGLVKESIEPSVHHLQDWIHNDSTGPIGFAHGTAHGTGGKQLLMDATAEVRVKEASQKLCDLLSLLMQGLLDNSEIIADELFETLDVNKSGKVTQAEYRAGFAETMGMVFDFSRFTKHVVRERKTGFTATFQDTDVSSILVWVGVAALVGLTYQVFKIKHRRG